MALTPTSTQLTGSLLRTPTMEPAWEEWESMLTSTQPHME